MTDIRGKKILLIGIGFYDYEKTIKEYLEHQGAKVFYFVSFYNTRKQRLLRRFGMVKKAISLSSATILSKIDEAPKDIDQIIIIKAEDFDQIHIDALKAKYQGVEMTLYLWDSLDRLPNKDLLLSNFSNIITFDRKDSETYGLKFRPLFARHFEQTKTNPIKYDISFVGDMHSMRYNFIRRIKRNLDVEGVNYCFVLTTGKFNKWYLINISQTVAKEDANIIITSRLPYSTYMEILNSSNVVLDIAHPRQSGLTMRTIETLAAGKKLLTTNDDIRYYPFNKNQYRILTDDFVIDYDFLRNRDVIESDMRDYSLEKFIDVILTV